ncbi:rRNA maturation RNase YbeY [Bacillus alkalicellulosilyticus]|uniref:rRNA maturation RNase YbeY n=1 Tax=Alkalihalobacterium alkalicellulosilyticum TaxID=1912214 RepID=UPI000998645F|nr:rRNA maturation RNase YbeY [Bacillus alkalicellulosilyticus]
MTVEIDMLDETESLTEKQLKLVEELLKETANKEKIKANSEVSISFVDNERIQEVNREYRNKDAVTDVISFAFNDNVDEELEIVGIEMTNVLGDIIISIPRAKEQAVEYNHSFERELGFLVVHGMLHLLGYDHMSEEEEKEMFSRQEEILNAYGLTR